MKLKIAGLLLPGPGTPGPLLPARWRPEFRALFPVRAEFIILLSFPRITEDFIRLVDLLELFLGGLFVFGDVGVVLSGEFAERLANVLVTRCPFNSQNPVIVPELDCHKFVSLRPCAVYRSGSSRRTRPECSVVPRSFNNSDAGPWPAATRPRSSRPAGPGGALAGGAGVPPFSPPGAALSCCKRRWGRART